MSLDFIVHTYLQAAPGIGHAEAESVVDAAAERARAKHADFDRFLPGIEFLSSVFFTDHTKMPLDDYLETLYCCVRHGDFTRPWRLRLKRPVG